MTEAAVAPSPAPVPERQPRTVSVSGAVLAWSAVTAVFLLLRLGPIWQAPVGGAEFAHLSGAWQARIGESDPRFVPTLFQAIAAGLLHFTTSEVPARIVAAATTATVPAAIYLLRGRLGEAGALLALLFLAFDGPSISLGTSASALGLDIALALWLFVALAREKRIRAWGWAIAGFLVATSGPLILPLVLGALGLLLAKGGTPPSRPAFWAVAGAAAGILAASLRFGLGADDGLRVPPFDLFAASFDEPWSTANAAEIAVLYTLPVLVAAAGAAAWRLNDLRRFGALPGHEALLLAWSGVSAVWLLAGATSHSTVPVVALTLPLALLAGPALAAALGAAWRADWQFARFVLPAAVVCGLLVLFVVVDWARLDRVGGSRDKALVFLFAALAAAIIGGLAANRRTLPTLTIAGVVVGGLLMVSNTLGVALSAVEEPDPSPLSPSQARQLRNIALEIVAERGGTIVVHPQFHDELTWPFRDSGTLIEASRVPPEAGVLIWPADLAQPEGFVPITGQWSLLRSVKPPTGDWLDYLRWLVERNSLTINQEAVAVYGKARE